MDFCANQEQRVLTPGCSGYPVAWAVRSPATLNEHAVKWPAESAGGRLSGPGELIPAMLWTVLSGDREFLIRLKSNNLAGGNRDALLQLPLVNFVVSFWIL